MQLDDAVAATGWHAALELGYRARGGETILARRRHCGPLRVQKPFYPEGPAVCHGIVVHPPAGVCGGDALELEVALESGAHALLTTPGAGKWYRSAGAEAVQHLRFRVADGAALEWLPQETIVFDGARANLSVCVELAPGASFIGWEILCLGRRASGERFSRGWVRMSSRIAAAGLPLWFEQGTIEGGAPQLKSPGILAGAGVCATLLASAPEIPGHLVADCRTVEASEGIGAVTRLPALIIARWLGDDAEAARGYFERLWRVLRPALLKRGAVSPRIWMT